MYKTVKRIADFILSLIVILFLAPFMVPISILLLLTAEHKLLYIQERIGHRNKPFLILKFATMLKASPTMGTGSITLRNDPRVTSVGRFLRKTKFNEVPQLFNVLIGDMSLIGPRPLMKVDFQKYPEDIQQTIYNVKPGITSLASVIFRDEERCLSETDMDPHEFDRKYIAPYKGQLEMWYQDNISLSTDLKILIYTILVVILPRRKYTFSCLKDLPGKPLFFKDKL